MLVLVSISETSCQIIMYHCISAYIHNAKLRESWLDFFMIMLLYPAHELGQIRPKCWYNAYLSCAALKCGPAYAKAPGHQYAQCWLNIRNVPFKTKMLHLWWKALGYNIAFWRKNTGLRAKHWDFKNKTAILQTISSLRFLEPEVLNHLFGKWLHDE